MTGRYVTRSGCPISHPLTEQGERAQAPERQNADQAETMPYRHTTYAQAISRCRGQSESHHHQHHSATPVAQMYPDPGGAPADQSRASSSTARTTEPSRFFHNQFFPVTQGFEENVAPMYSVEVPTNIEFCPGCLKTTAPPGWLGQAWDKYQQWIDRETMDDLRRHVKALGAKLKQTELRADASEKQLQQLQHKFSQQASQMDYLQSSCFLLAAQKDRLEGNLKESRCETRQAQERAEDMEYKAGELHSSVKALQMEVAKCKPLAEKVPELESELDLLQERLSESVREAQHQRMQIMELEAQLKGTTSAQQSVGTITAPRPCTSFEIGFGVVEQMHLLNSIAMHGEALAQMIMKTGGQSNQVIKEKLQIPKGSPLACCRSLTANTKDTVRTLILQHILINAAWESVSKSRWYLINNVYDSAMAFLVHFNRNLADMAASSASQLMSNMYRCIYVSVDNYVKRTARTDDGYVANGFDNLCNEMTQQLLQDWGLPRGCFKEAQKLVGCVKLLSLLVRSLASEVPNLAIALAQPGTAFDADSMEPAVREVPCHNLDRPMVLCCSRPGLQYQTHDGTRHILVKMQVVMLVPDVPPQPQTTPTQEVCKAASSAAPEKPVEQQATEQPGKTKTRSIQQAPRSGIAPPPAGPDAEYTTDVKPSKDYMQPHAGSSQEPQAPFQGVVETLIAQVSGTAEVQSSRQAADLASVEAAAMPKPALQNGKVTSETTQAEQGHSQQPQSPGQGIINKLLNQVSGSLPGTASLVEPQETGRKPAIKHNTDMGVTQRNAVPVMLQTAGSSGYAGSVMLSVTGVRQDNDDANNAALQQGENGNGGSPEVAAGDDNPLNAPCGAMRGHQLHEGAPGDKQPQGPDSSLAGDSHASPMETDPDEYEYAMVD